MGISQIEWGNSLYIVLLIVGALIVKQNIISTTPFLFLIYSYLGNGEYDILARSLLRDYPYLANGATHTDAVVSCFYFDFYHFRSDKLKCYSHSS